MRLEDTTIRSLPSPQSGQKLYRDDTLPGFGCRVSQGGTKTFVLVHGADRRFITIGRYPVLSLSQARAEAKRLLAEFTLGKSRPQSITYQAAVDLFLKDKAQGRRPSTVNSYRVKLARLNFKGRVADVTHDDAARKINRITAPSERSHILVAGKVFFNWCINRRYLTENPLIGLTKAKSIPRKRVLNDQELKAIWEATAKPATFHRIIRLCILTGQRRGELAQLKPAYIENGVCTFPSTLTKNHRDHAFPLTPLAHEFLTFDGFNNWGDAKEQLDKILNIPHWVIHDLRRTFRTNLSRLGVPPHISERLLNHVSYRNPMEDVYDHYRFLPEMRAALDKWENFLGDILGRLVHRAA